MIACYAAGVWANCAWPVVVRGFYALNDYGTPVRVGAWMVGLNLVLNLTLIWPLAEAGLAISTTVAAAVQVVRAGGDFLAPAGRRWTGAHLAATAARTILATLVMAVVGLSGARAMPDGDRLSKPVVRVGVPLAAGHGGLLRRSTGCWADASWVC